MKKPMYDFSKFDLEKYVETDEMLSSEGIEDFLRWEYTERAKKECESPIEQMIYVHMLRDKPDDMYIKTQVNFPLEMKQRRVDFLIGLVPPIKGSIRPLFIVETDGKYHNDEEQVMKDKSCDREILNYYSLPVVRFTGSEIYKDAGSCAYEVEKLFKVYKQNLMTGIFTEKLPEEDYFTEAYRKKTDEEYRKFLKGK